MENYEMRQNSLTSVEKDEDCLIPCGRRSGLVGVLERNIVMIPYGTVIPKHFSQSHTTAVIHPGGNSNAAKSHSTWHPRDSRVKP
jgi:hypothetical protein